MKESDWKVFKEIKDIALERYCSSVLNESNNIILNDQEHSHERFLYLYALLQNRNKHLSLMFDGHSRSKAWLQLIAMRKEGLVDDAMISKLSDDFKGKTDPTKLL